MIITVSGLPKSGTSSVCEHLVGTLDGTVAYVNGGDIFRSRAQSEGMELDEFSKHVNENPEIDREIDGTLRAIINAYAEYDPHVDIDNLPVDPGPLEADHLLVESRLAGWIAGEHADISVWLDASREIRSNRAQDTGEDETAVIERAWDERMRYDWFYGIDLDETEIYDLLINTAKWSPGMIVATIGSLVGEFDRHDDEVTIESNPQQSPTNQFDEVIPDHVYC